MSVDAAFRDFIYRLPWPDHPGRALFTNDRTESPVGWSGGGRMAWPVVEIRGGERQSGPERTDREGNEGIAAAYRGDRNRIDRNRSRDRSRNR